MKKFTLKEIIEKAGDIDPILTIKIRDLQQSMKNCRKRLVARKKDLAYYYDCFDRNLQLYQKWVKGESIQDVNSLHYIKLSDESITRHIANTRKYIRDEVKLLYSLRKQNNELFKELLDKAVLYLDKQQTIELTRDQARTVFNKLYSLFDSKEYFEKVTIKIG